jgi:hypothetical protein
MNLMDENEAGKTLNTLFTIESHFGKPAFARSPGAAPRIAPLAAQARRLPPLFRASGNRVELTVVSIA